MPISNRPMMSHQTGADYTPVILQLEDRSGHAALRTDSGLSQHTIGGTSRSPRTLVKAWEISTSSTFAPAPFNNGPPRSTTTLEDYLGELSGMERKHETRLFRIEQQHSREHIDIETGDVKALLDHVDAFPALHNVFGAFSRSGFVARASAHFSPPIQSDDALELCCLLKYVEMNERKIVSVDGSKSFCALQRWSLRQVAFYQSFDPINHHEAVLLVNPSVESWQMLRDACKHPTKPCKPFESWMRMPMLVFASLPAKWSAYIDALHEAVLQVKNDASFTKPEVRRINEADTSTLQTCVDLMDRLQYATHVLGNNISILDLVLCEAKKRQAIAVEPSTQEMALFESGISNTRTELQFHFNHIELMIKRLDRTSTTISNLIQLRGSYNMEQMTKRSILEAQAVRIIALVTLFFIPPTFTAGFLQMGGLDFEGSRSGHLIVNAKPEFLFFLAITIPLMVVVIGTWLMYDWHSRQKAKRENEQDLKRPGGGLNIV